MTTEERALQIDQIIGQSGAIKGLGPGRHPGFCDGPPDRPIHLRRRLHQGRQGRRGPDRPALPRPRLQGPELG